jgi:hypothetical protein
MGLAAGLGLGVTLLCLLRQILQDHHGSATLVWHWTVWCVPTLRVFGVATVLMIGLVGRAFEEEDRVVEPARRLVDRGERGLAGAVRRRDLWTVRNHLWAELGRDPGRGLIAPRWRASCSGGASSPAVPDTSKWLNLATEAPYIFVAGLLIVCRSAFTWV